MTFSLFGEKVYVDSSRMGKQRLVLRCLQNKGTIRVEE
jgi:hypothetical protein